MDILRSVVFSTLFASMAASSALAQCATPWLPFPLPGVGNQVVTSVFWDPDGAGPLPPQLVIGGNFSTAGGQSANRIARWDGVSWQALGSGIDDIVRSLAVLPNGDVVAGGRFLNAGGIAASRIARWDGSTWRAIGAGVNPLINNFQSVVLAMTVLPSGDLIAVGNFNEVDGFGSSFIAALTTTCPATATPITTACVGPAGPLVLVADTLPWTGSTFSSTVTGFASTALGVSLLGIGSQNLPLSLLHPAGLPNCDLLATTDAVLLVFPLGGVSGYQFTIPNNLVFAGAPLSHQFVQGELDSFGNLVSLSSSNALSLVVGSF